MNLIDKLNDVSGSSKELSSFLSENINSVYDFFVNQRYSDLLEFKESMDSYFLSNLKVIKKLDISDSYNYSFIVILIETCERFGFSLYFQRLLKILEKYNENISISKRIQATAMYFIGIKEFSDYEKILNPFLDKLMDSYETEEDNINKVNSVFINFYAKVVYNFGQFNRQKVLLFRDTISGKKDQFFFLNEAPINEILNIDISDFEKFYHEILNKLDSYLNRKKIDISFVDEKYLIEDETEYSRKLDFIDSDFKSIQNLNKDLYSPIKSTKIFYSMGRGVSILTKQEQLLAYIFSFGKMHYHKLISAFDFLPEDFFMDTIDIIDWGCGQAIGTVSYIDFLNQHNHKNNISQIILNEPSQIALKRGNLHVKKMNPDIKVLTINKDLDSLNKNDFNISNNTKLHIFSNILDIDYYNMDKLTDLIKESFAGINYFIIVSPYITKLKNDRIDLFVEAFENKSNFNLIKSIRNKKGEWKNGWTRIVKVFNTDL